MNFTVAFLSSSTSFDTLGVFLIVYFMWVDTRLFFFHNLETYDVFFFEHIKIQILLFQSFTLCCVFLYFKKYIHKIFEFWMLFGKIGMHLLPYSYVINTQTFDIKRSLLNIHIKEVSHWNLSFRFFSSSLFFSSFCLASTFL